MFKLIRENGVFRREMLEDSLRNFSNFSMRFSLSEAIINNDSKIYLLNSEIGSLTIGRVRTNALEYNFTDNLQLAEFKSGIDYQFSEFGITTFGDFNPELVKVFSSQTKLIEAYLSSTKRESIATILQAA